MHPRPIILLDLNFTLVANSRDLGKPFLPGYPVERETYRQWLVELLRPYTVELITARPDFLEERTMANIKRLCQGWMPSGKHFNPERYLRAPDWKERVLRDRIFPIYGTDPGRFLALESNQDTRAMYARHKIAAVPVPTAHAWSRIPDINPAPPEPADGQQSLFG
jgi:hypothetical protein